MVNNHVPGVGVTASPETNFHVIAAFFDMMQKNNLHSHQFIQQQNQQLQHHHHQQQQHHFQHQQFQQHYQNQIQTNLQQQREQQERSNHGSAANPMTEQQHGSKTTFPSSQPSVASTHCPVDYPPPHPQFHQPLRPHFQPYFSHHQQFVVNTNISIQSQQNDLKSVATIAINCGGGENNKVPDCLSLAVLPPASNSTVNISNNINGINKTEFTASGVVGKSDDTRVAPAFDVDDCNVESNYTPNTNDSKSRNKSKKSPRHRHHRCHNNLSHSSSSNSSHSVVPKGAESSEVTKNDDVGCCVDDGNGGASHVKSVKARRESCSSSPLLQSLIDSQFTLLAAKANPSSDTSTSTCDKKDVGAAKRGGDSSGKGGQVNAEGKVVPVLSGQQKQHHKSKRRDERRKKSSSSASISESLLAESVGEKETKCPTSEHHTHHSSHVQNQTSTHNHQTEPNKQLNHLLRESEPLTQQQQNQHTPQSLQEQQNQHTPQSLQEQQFYHQDAGSSHPPVDPGILYYHSGQSSAVFGAPSYPHGFPQQGLINSAHQHFPLINPAAEYQPSPHFPNHQIGGPQSLHQVHQNLHHQHQMQQQQFNMALYHQQQGLHSFPHQMLPSNIPNLHQPEAPSSCHGTQLPPQGLPLLHPPYHHPHHQHLGGGFQNLPQYPGFHQNAFPGFFNAGNNSGMSVNNMGTFVPGGQNSHTSQYPQTSFPGLQQSFSGGRRVGHETPLNLPPPCLIPGHHPSTVGYPMPSEFANANRSIVSPASCLNDLPVHLSNLFIENKPHGNNSNDNDDVSVAGSSVGSRRHHRRNHHRKSPASSLASEPSRVLQENVTAENVKSITVSNKSNRSSSDVSRTDISASHNHNIQRPSGKENVHSVNPGVDSNIRYNSPCSDSASSVRDDNLNYTAIRKSDGSSSSNRVDKRTLKRGKSTKQRINAPSDYSEGTLNNIVCDGGDYERAFYMSDPQQHTMNQPQQRGGGGLVFRNINSICAITPPQSPYRGDSSGVDVLHSGEETASNATVSSSSSTVRRQHHNHDKHHNANRYHGHLRGHNQQPQEEMAMHEARASIAPNMSSFDSAISYSNSPVGGSPSIGTSGVGSGYHGAYSWEHDHSYRGPCNDQSHGGPRNDPSHVGLRNDQSHGDPRNDHISRGSRSDHCHGNFRNDHTNEGSRNDRSSVGSRSEYCHGVARTAPSDHPASSRHHKSHQPRGGDGSHLPDTGPVALSDQGRMFGDEQQRDASFPPLPLARSRHHNGATGESVSSRNNNNSDGKTRGAKSGSRPAATTIATAAVAGNIATSSCASSKDERSSKISTKSYLNSTPAAENSGVTAIKTSTSSKRNQIKNNKNYFSTSMDENNNSIVTRLVEQHHHHHHDIKEEEEEEVEGVPTLSTAITTSSRPTNPLVTNDGDDSLVSRRKCQAVKKSSTRGQQHHRDGDVCDVSSNASDIFHALDQPQQIGTVTVGVAARRMIQPLPQLVFARQRLSSRELPDVLTPDTPQFPCAYTKFKLNLK